MKTSELIGKLQADRKATQQTPPGMKGKEFNDGAFIACMAGYAVLIGITIATMISMIG